MPVTQSPANANNIANDDAILRSDVRKLGDLLGQSLVRQEGQELLDLVESVRKAVREGGGIELLEKLSVEDSVQLVRAFSTYFHLANVAEQVHRARVLAQSRAVGGSWLSTNSGPFLYSRRFRTMGQRTYGSSRIYRTPNRSCAPFDPK